jgi:hypothetical protein
MSLAYRLPSNHPHTPFSPFDQPNPTHSCIAHAFIHSPSFSSSSHLSSLPVFPFPFPFPSSSTSLLSSPPPSSSSLPLPLLNSSINHTPPYIPGLRRRHTPTPLYGYAVIRRMPPQTPLRATLPPSVSPYASCYRFSGASHGPLT